MPTTHLEAREPRWPVKSSEGSDTRLGESRRKGDLGEEGVGLFDVSDEFEEKGVGLWKSRGNLEADGVGLLVEEASGDLGGAGLSRMDSRPLG